MWKKKQWQNKSDKNTEKATKKGFRKIRQKSARKNVT